MARRLHHDGDAGDDDDDDDNQPVITIITVITIDCGINIFSAGGGRSGGGVV